MTDTNIEQLIEALNDATTRFTDDEDLGPNYLYIDRTTDGEWSAEFRYSENSSPLAMEMTEWTIGKDAMKALDLCRSGHTREVANEIATGWDQEWDSED